MKKQVKKLMLAKETLVHLEKNLAQVAGGVTAVADCGTQTCAEPYSSCDFSGYQTCLSCAQTCTTNYC